jgi:hypothetical protein
MHRGERETREREREREKMTRTDNVSMVGCYIEYPFSMSASQAIMTDAHDELSAHHVQSENHGCLLLLAHFHPSNESRKE